MRWIQDNPFLAGLAALTVAGTGLMIFLLTQSLAQFQQMSEAYVQAVQKLHGLQNHSPFPSQENLDKTKALAEQYRGELNDLRLHLAKMEVPLNPDVKPQQFADDLRAAVNKTIERAAAAGVTLPRDFYLGFGQYANAVPSQHAAPALARQLVIINQIVARLIDYKVQSIDSLERRALPEETSGPGSDQKKQEVLTRLPFDLAFTAEQAKFRVAFNSLLGAEQFLIVRALSIQNTNLAGPPIVQSERNSNGGGAASPTAPGSPTSDLNVILGQELVKATLRIEIIDFAEPVEAKK